MNDNGQKNLSQSDTAKIHNQMKPITFECSIETKKSANKICTNMADVTLWKDFNGYAMLPGIDEAVYELKTENMLGSIINVKNSDGSKHDETITKWNHGVQVEMLMNGFSAPLSKLSTHFVEEWSFNTIHDSTIVKRQFKLYAKSTFTKPFLWLISLLFRQAIKKHLKEIS